MFSFVSTIKPKRWSIRIRWLLYNFGSCKWCFFVVIYSEKEYMASKSLLSAQPTNICTNCRFSSLFRLLLLTFQLRFECSCFFQLEQRLGLFFNSPSQFLSIFNDLKLCLVTDLITFMLFLYSMFHTSIVDIVNRFLYISILFSEHLI